MAKKAPVVSKPAAKGEVSKAPVMKSVVAPVSTPVRNTPIPRVPVAMPAKMPVSHEMIARRAFEIHCSGFGGNQDHNWLRAEAELRG